jgi:DNA-binding beta-propeller fold protein YncE
MAWHCALGAPATLRVEAKIPLPRVEGRIDHLAYDAARKHLFVAELGNGSVDVVDVAQRRPIYRIMDLREPQGVAYSAEVDLLYVASGGDGTLRAFRGKDFLLVQKADAGDDADNLRVDDAARRVYVGGGSGSLGVFRADTLDRLQDIALKGHPESFQLGNDDARIFVNVPDAHEIVVVDRDAARAVAHWPTGDWRANYPMALDAAGRRVLVAFRQPARLAAFDSRDGKVLAQTSSCSDADDVFVDEARARIYVTCGDGVVDVLARGTLVRLARIATTPGARTGLYVRDIDRLFVAARAQPGGDAAIWILAPVP